MSRQQLGPRIQGLGAVGRQRNVGCSGRANTRAGISRDRIGLAGRPAQEHSTSVLVGELGPVVFPQFLAPRELLISAEL